MPYDHLEPLNMQNLIRLQSNICEPLLDSMRRSHQRARALSVQFFFLLHLSLLLNLSKIFHHRDADNSKSQAPLTHLLIWDRTDWKDLTQKEGLLGGML